jgi:hypothetical protein
VLHRRKLATSPAPIDRDVSETGLDDAATADDHRHPFQPARHREETYRFPVLNALVNEPEFLRRGSA